jgi:hypothetical protein
MADHYLATRYSSPGEWSIKLVTEEYALEPGSPAAVFATFTEAKEWLTDQTRAWVEGFRDDAIELRGLRKSDVLEREIE